MVYYFIFDSTPLHDAVENGFPRVVEYLIKHGADTKAINLKIKVIMI